MDVPDDNRDIKLYRASADLLPDISRGLDELLEEATDATKPSDHSSWVADSRVEKLISLVSGHLATCGVCADQSISARSFSRMASITGPLSTKTRQPPDRRVPTLSSQWALWESI